MPALPPTDDDERYAKMLIGHVQDLAQQLGQVREQIKEDTAQLLRGVREDMFRTTMAIHARILSYEDELVKDRTQRDQRQHFLDKRLSTIEHNQRFLVRLAVVGGLVTVGVAMGVVFALWLL